MILFLSPFFPATGLRAQCMSPDPVDIPDPGTVTIEIPIGGLTDAMLSSPTQGICGVEINFTHEYLGDLTVSLVSPNGTIVQLIGPTTTSTFPTNLSAWDVDFVPCGTPAVPDAGFAPVWSNLQPWQALAFYDGSYHPFDGCLEDFNAGSANGIWQVIVEDNGEFQFGTILGVTLQFCNPDGLDCTPCLAHAGTLSPGSLTLCAGESLSTATISVMHGDSTPPAAFHDYVFLLVDGDAILQHGEGFSLVPPIGSYSLCGLSYAEEDALLVSALLDAGDYALLQDALDAALFCGQITSACVDIEVLEAPDSIFTAAQLCAGEAFLFRGQPYTLPGVYYQTLDGPGICDTIARVEISARGLDVTTSEAGVLGCGSTVTIGSMVDGAMGPFTYSWSTANGNIVSDPGLPEIMVDQPGTYVLAVSDGICSGTSAESVPEGPGFPSIIASGGTITCDQPAITVTPVFIPADGVIHWTGPGGFMAGQADVVLNIPGQYIVTIENIAGCASADTIDIGIDTMTSTPAIVVEKNCQDSFVALHIETVIPYDSLWWTGPGMLTAMDDTIYVTQTGVYNVAVDFPNGCRRVAATFIDADFTVPDIAVDPVADTINCGEVILLSASSGIPGATIRWEGPQGQAGTGPTFLAIQSGVYVATAQSPNGCIATDTALLYEGSDLFDVQVIRDTLDCATDTARIGVISSVADLFHWVNHTGPDSLEAVIGVTMPGTYQVLMTDTITGCVVSASITVPQDLQPPSFSASVDTITCLDPIADLMFIPVAGNDYAEISWTLPDMTVVPGPTLETDSGGAYILTAVGLNGCRGELEVDVMVDTLGPALLADPGILGCLDTLTLEVLSPDPITGFDWSGPGIVSSAGTFARVAAPGTYTFSGTGVNGCVGEIAIMVDSNYAVPAVTLVADSLTCLGPARLEAVTGETGLTYGWTGPDGLPAGDQPVLWASLPGMYVLTVIGTNNCPFQDTLMLSAPRPPEISVDITPITCTMTQGEFLAVPDPPDAVVAWLDLSGSLLASGAVYATTSLDPVVVQATGSNGCSTMDTVRMQADTARPMATIVQVGEVQCQMRDVMLDGSGSTPTGLQFAWSTLDGLLTSDPGQAIVGVRDTGTYQLIVTDPGSGCTDTSAWTVIAVSGAIGVAEILADPPDCHGELTGSIEVISVPGGVPPLAYSLNGGPEQSSPRFENLAAGAYLLGITDQSGCRLDSLLSLESTPPFSVSAGEDLEIPLGEVVDLAGMTDLPSGLLADQGWADYFASLCMGCQTLQISPAETADFIFTVSALSGCSKSDTIRVFVVEEANFFIPNVFSPNGDGINDEIRLVVASGVTMVRRWVIFDRWGQAVFGREAFDPADATVAWDGRTPEGQPFNPAVFAWVLELELTNGEVRTHHGNITLLR